MAENVKQNTRGVLEPRRPVTHPPHVYMQRSTDTGVLRTSCNIVNESRAVGAEDTFTLSLSLVRCFKREVGHYRGLPSAKRAITNSVRIKC
ncbi:hypothetical protein EVAR_49104_1 [Eumeta japonica]|uniref:Uncharacterized protein n=1 Tax=Eumeta variegata TaxID=151549 RepID=A0A4C1ZT87_EUMVA|nr:hypothetical protein EVAR_49104_1 [Eumeta japonica]